MAAPTFGAVGTTLNATSGVTTATMGKPAGVVSGSGLLAVVYKESTATVTSSGWVEAPDSPVVVTGDFNLHIFEKVAGGSEPSTYGFTWSGGAFAGGFITRVADNVGTTSMFDVTNKVSKTTTADGTVPAVNDTSTVNDTLWVYIAAAFNTGVFTPPSGFTEVVDVYQANTASQMSLAMAVKTQSSPGGAGSPTSSFATSAATGAWLGALKPAVAAALSGSFFPFFEAPMGATAAPPEDEEDPPFDGLTLSSNDDLSAVFLPSWTSPAVESSGAFEEVSTPHGDGWQFTCPDTKVATWDPTCKDLLGIKYRDDGLPSPAQGNAERWEWWMYLPTQTVRPAWHTGVLWEFHTDGSSGHHVGIYYELGPAFRLSRQIAAGGNYDYQVGPEIEWDTWLHFKVEVKWSTSTDGYYKVWIDDTQWTNAVGVQTLFDGEPYLQFGWYAELGSGLTNRVTFSSITMEEI